MMYTLTVLEHAAYLLINMAVSCHKGSEILILNAILLETNEGVALQSSVNYVLTQEQQHITCMFAFFGRNLFSCARLKNAYLGTTQGIF